MNYENKQQEEKKRIQKKQKRATSKSLTIETLSQTEDEKRRNHTRDCFETLRMLKATNHTLSRWGNGYKKGDITSCISTIYRRQKTIREYSKWNIHSIEVQHYSKGNKHHLERNATR
ncbi:hypothetical protein ACIXQ0_04855 [Bacteroides fragilis]